MANVGAICLPILAPVVHGRGSCGATVDARLTGHIAGMKKAPLKLRGRENETPSEVGA
jgi:hypothetical protein